LHSPGWTFEGDLKRLNKLHAVLPIGGKTRVVTFGELEEFPGRETIVMTQTFQQGMLTLQRVFCLEHKGRAPQPSEVTDHRRARAALGEAEGWGRTRRRQTYARQPRSFLRARTDPAPAERRMLPVLDLDAAIKPAAAVGVLAVLGNHALQPHQAGVAEQTLGRLFCDFADYAAWVSCGKQIHWIVKLASQHLQLFCFHRATPRIDWIATRKLTGSPINGHRCSTAQPN
jgi:hypothetical protein